MSDSCDHMNWNLPDYSVHGILQAITLEYVAISFFRGSSRPRNRTRNSCIAGRFFTDWAMREAQQHVSKDTQDGRVEGCALIFPNENSKITTRCWTTIDRRMLDPTKKWNPTSKGKGQQDGRRGKIVIRIKPHTCQRCLEGSTKPCEQQDPGPHRDWATPASGYLSVSCGGMS